MKSLATVLVLTLVGLSTQQTDYCASSLCSNGGPHIACNGLTAPAASCGSQAKEVTLDSTQQALILDLHNALRSTIASGKQNYSSNAYYPSAARMGTLQWDPELASIAANNARGCVFTHDKCRSTTSFPYAGQNIAISSYMGQTMETNDLIKGFVNGWYSEYANANPSFIGEYPKEYKGPAIGHFTQIVADRCTRVGCSLVSWVDNDGWTNQYFVCNYAFTNMVSQPVYVAGDAGSKCTTGCNTAYPGLCSVNENISATPF